MKKCIRCGASFLTHRRVKLKDAEICGKCYKGLGFTNYLISDMYKYEEIKDGRDAYTLFKKKEEIKKAVIESVSVQISGNKDLVCTEEERMVFNEFQRLVPELELVRKSDNYVTAVIEGWDIVRFKYTHRAKWVTFPLLVNEKIYIEDPEDVQDLAGKLTESMEIYRKYS